MPFFPLRLSLAIGSMLASRDGNIYCLNPTSLPLSKLYDNGQTTHSGGSAVGHQIAADDFILNEDAKLTQMTVFVSDGPESEGRRWDGTVEWWILYDDGGKPGDVMSSGLGQNIRQSNIDESTLGDRTFEIAFDFNEEIEISQDMIYWIALHLDSGFDQVNVFGDATSSATNNLSYKGGELVNGAPDFNGQYGGQSSTDKAFILVGDRTQRLFWSYQTGSRVDSSPAVAEGRVYVGSRGSVDSQFYCLDAATGELAWSYGVVYGFDASPAVAEGKVYVGSMLSSFYCLDAETGVAVWTFLTQGGFRSSPAVAEGRVYVGSDDNNVYCFGRRSSGSSCVIATAAFGSEIEPEVQFLREFRDFKVLSTFSGSNFINAFNVFYYSWSPSVADGIRENTLLSGLTRTVISPLIGVLSVSSALFDQIQFSGELGIILVGFIAASLIGAIYIGIPLSIGVLISKPFAYLLNTKRENAFPLVGLLFSGFAVTSIGAITQSMIISTVGSVLLVLSAIVCSALFTALIAILIKKRATTYFAR